MANKSVHRHLYCRGGGGDMVDSQIFAVGNAAVFYCVGSCADSDAVGAPYGIKERIAKKAMLSSAFGGVARRAVRRTFLVDTAAYNRAWATYVVAEGAGAELG